ncbi:MAG: hypothetical protein ACRDS1_15500, partial [Pseudonocardiaceae bacterium]
MSDRIDRVLALERAEDTTAELQALARTHGAESRAADEVTKAVLLGKFRFAPGLGWVQWDGRRWDPDTTVEASVIEAVRQFADVTERDYRARAVAADTELQALIDGVTARVPEDQRMGSNGKLLTTVALVDKAAEAAEKDAYDKAAKEYLTAKQQADIWLNQLSAAKLSAITKLCRGADGILTRTAAFDTHPDLLNCRNGVVDLRTGQLLPHYPDLLITHLAGGDYDPAARSPLWDRALA